MKKYALILILACSLHIFGAFGCGNYAPPPTYTVGLSPASIQMLDINQSASFTATVSPDSSGQLLTWNVNCPPGVSTCGAVARASTASGIANKYSAPANTASAETVVVTAALASDPSKFASVKVLVNPALTLVDAAPLQPQRGIVNQPFSFDLMPFVQGGTQPFTWSIKSGTLPAGLALTANTGMVTGNPTSAATNVIVVFTCMDSGSPPPSLPADLQVHLTINPPPPPTISTSPDPPLGKVNNPYRFDFTATGGAAGLIWSETGALPPNLTFDSNGTLFGEPGGAGSFQILVEVQDALGQKAVPQSFTIQVLPSRFSATASMDRPRINHTATLLPDGRVLLAGGTDGIDSATSIASALLYDPSSQTFTSTGIMSTPRYSHTATLLNNGEILMTGGMGVNGTELDTAELFNPTTGTFAPKKGSMAVGREGHTVTLLGDGKVLLTGGASFNGPFLSSAEVYDPSTGLFTPVNGAMSIPRRYQTATLLANGQVLVAGGGGGSGSVSADLYDPATKIFTPTGDMKNARFSHTATLLPNGKVLIAGGGTLERLITAEEYDPGTGVFTPTGNMTSARLTHTATLLNDGTVFIAGGKEFIGNCQGFVPEATASVERFDPATATFKSIDYMEIMRSSHTATLLKNGDVLMAGGIWWTYTQISACGVALNAHVTATAEIFH